jgi:peptide/nickel transport system permease protein
MSTLERPIPKPLQATRHRAAVLPARTLVLVVVGLLLLTTGMSINSPKHFEQQAGTEQRASMLGNITSDAGDYPPVVQGATVRFNGSGSQSTVPIMNFTWTFDDNGARTLYGLRPNYTFMNVGNFSVTLIATDVDYNTSSNHTIITVAKDLTPPVASLGDRIVPPGGNRTVTLDASRCTDDGKIVNYTWYLFTEDLYFYGVNMTFTFEKTGKHLVTLNVTDAGGNYATRGITVDIQREPTIVEKNWVLIFIVLPLIMIFGYALVGKLRRDRTLITSADVSKLKLAAKNALSVSRRFRKSKGGMIGLTILVIFVMMAILAPLIASKYNTASLPANAPRWIDYNLAWQKPSLKYPFGTEYYGRDVYTLTVWGSRASLTVGLLASLISIVLGTAAGLTAGYFGRISDEVLMRITDFFLVIPWFPLMIVFASLLGRSFTNIIIVIGITSWPSTARIVRASVLSLKEKAFVERAVAVGSSGGRIIWRHILPNVFPLIFANTILLVANSIFSESFLDFFGLGPTNVISWGLVLEWAYEYSAFSNFAWWDILAPGACIVLLIMAFYLIGDALDEVLNPKLRKR